MLNKKCRIENSNGFKFYEKDILYDDYTFTYDIEISADIQYITSGFGIALIDCGSCSINDKPDSYLFKIGYREASVYFSNATGTELLQQISCPYVTTIQNNMNFTLKKSGKKVSIYYNGQMLLSTYLKKDLDKYNIGYYSNVGNIINDVKIKSNIPDNWIVNMKNTNGGYIEFQNDSFIIKDCLNNAEIEQANIELKPGTYYFKNKLSEVNEKCDLKYYVYESVDDRYFDETKNLLDKNNSFTLSKKTSVNIKIVGTNGKIGDLSLSTDKDSDYISTTIHGVNFDGSYLDIYINELNKIEWTGIVYKSGYKNFLDENIIYGLILDSSNAITPEDALIAINETYDYEFNMKDYTFYIKKNNEVIFSSVLNKISNKITIFKNISGLITKLILYKKDGTVKDVITQDEEINVINANITSPIIAVDEYNIPIDLSSSYRLCIYDDYKKYIFTNWEREIFDPKRSLKLEKPVINQGDSVMIYGLKDDDIDLKNIYNVPEDNINSIDLLTKNYDYIKESDAYIIDKENSLVYLKDSQVNKYKKIIIDYLKDDSYCINYNYLNNTYKVDVSSSNKNIKLLYDSSSVESNSDIEYTQVKNYKVTDISGNVNGYIVLTQGDEE